MANQKQLWKIFNVGGREFRIDREYDQEVDESYPVYPDFMENPEYTDDGRPFTTAEHEGCHHYRPAVSEDPETDDCGGCFWFRRDETPYDIIGVCMCNTLKHEPENPI